MYNNSNNVIIKNEIRIRRHTFNKRCDEATHTKTDEKMMFLLTKHLFDRVCG